jgi:hypothetical protein
MTVFCSVLSVHSESLYYLDVLDRRGRTPRNISFKHKHKNTASGGDVNTTFIISDTHHNVLILNTFLNLPPVICIVDVIFFLCDDEACFAEKSVQGFGGKARRKETTWKTKA